MTGASSAQNRRPPRLNHKKSRAGCQRCKARRVKVSADPFPNAKHQKPLSVLCLPFACPLPALRQHSLCPRVMMNIPNATNSAMRPNLRVEDATAIMYPACTFTTKSPGLQAARHHCHQIPRCNQTRSSQSSPSTKSSLPHPSTILSRLMISWISLNHANAVFWNCDCGIIT